MKKTKHFSILDAGLEFEGTLSSRGKLLISGTLKGQLSGDFITIGEWGEVRAEIRARTLFVGGRCKGKIHVEHVLVVLPTGVCEGEIECGDLVVEPGGVVNAKVTRRAIPVGGTRELEGPSQKARLN